MDVEWFDEDFKKIWLDDVHMNIVEVTRRVSTVIVEKTNCILISFPCLLSSYLKYCTRKLLVRLFFSINCT